MWNDAALEFVLRVEMLSDWHVGIGAGRQHSIDRLIARDDDDLPYIPASTIRGIWRDAAETLAFGLDGGKDDAWTKFVSTIFGSQVTPSPPNDLQSIVAPAPSSLVCQALHLDPALRIHLIGSEHQERRDALTYVKPGVAIERRTGMAKDEHLRFDEVAMGGLVLTGTARLNLRQLPPGTSEVARDFLIAAAALIERLGAKRRRGLGRCKVDARCGAVGFNTQAIDRLETAKSPAIQVQQARCEEAAKPVYGAATPASTQTWHSVELIIELLSPTIIPDEVLGNVVTTQHCIPGSVLLPIVARAATAAGEVDIFSSISAGTLQVLRATPEIDGRRSISVPMCWERPKDKTSTAPLRSILVAQPRGTQYVPLRTGFVALGQGQVSYLNEPALRLTTHNVIEDTAQRPTEDVGGVYSYEAIAAGQRFRSAIRIRGSSELLGKIRSKLNGTEHWLGRGKPGGYGHVRISVSAEYSEDGSDKRGPGIIETVIDMWLTSDLAIRDATLEATTTPQAIAKLLSQQVGVDLKVGRHALRSRRLESWHSQWRLPRPTIVAVQAGSAIRFQLPEILSAAERQQCAEQLLRIEAQGLGERRAEGFGQVRFNHEMLTSPPHCLDPVKVLKGRRTGLGDEKAGELEPRFVKLLAQIDFIVRLRKVGQQGDQDNLGKLEASA